MARKGKKKAQKEPPAGEGDNAMEEDSGHENDDEDSDDDIPDIVAKDSDEDNDAGVEETNTAKGTRDKKSNNMKSEDATAHTTIPFMDTFYQLSSEDLPKDRSIAARDLIHHCFLTSQGVNKSDSAYALTRLMNGLCTGRAASRQGFASCLSTFLRVAYSPSLNESYHRSVMEDILQEDDYAKNLMEDVQNDAHPAVIVREKLLSTTQFLAAEVNNNDKGSKKKNHVGGKMKGSEERDHAFGRLFGILAVVRSGILCSKDFPSGVSSTLCICFVLVNVCSNC